MARPAIQPDLSRLGIFKELGYTTIGDPYITRSSCVERNKVGAGYKPMLLAGGYSKQKCAYKDGYFSDFVRIYEGEGINNMINIRRTWQNEIKSKIIGPNWLSSGPTKMRSGVGSPYGCFTETYTAMPPGQLVKIETEKRRNFYTRPGKKGTGYGYVDVTIGPYPPWRSGEVTLGQTKILNTLAQSKHKLEMMGPNEFISTCARDRLFDEGYINGINPLAPGGPSIMNIGIGALPKAPNSGPTFLPSSFPKTDGGMKDGAFSKWPEFMPDPYIGLQKMAMDLSKPGKKNELGLNVWIPQSGTALVMPTSSIINKNVDLEINNVTRKKKLFVTKFCKK